MRRQRDVNTHHAIAPDEPLANLRKSLCIGQRLNLQRRDPLARTELLRKLSAPLLRLVERLVGHLHEGGDRLTLIVPLHMQHALVRQPLRRTAQQQPHLVQCRHQHRTLRRWNALVAPLLKESRLAPSHQMKLCTQPVAIFPRGRLDPRIRPDQIAVEPTDAFQHRCRLPRQLILVGGTPKPAAAAAAKHGASLLGIDNRLPHRDHLRPNQARLRLGHNGLDRLTRISLIQQRHTTRRMRPDGIAAHRNPLYLRHKPRTLGHKITHARPTTTPTRSYSVASSISTSTNWPGTTGPTSSCSNDR